MRRPLTALLIVIGVAAVVAASLHQQVLDPQISEHLQAQEAPTLKGADWINVKDKAPNLKGKVTVLHFWTFACINCKHNLPYYAKWEKQYDPKEVQIIGVHTPELEIEKNPANVRAEVKKLGIDYPVVIDGKNENWDAYHVTVWPTVFLIDKKGNLRYYWKGELQWNGADGFDELSREIDELRAEKD